MKPMCDRWPDEVLLDALPDRLPVDFLHHAEACGPCAVRLRDLKGLVALRGPERLEPSADTRAAVFDVIRSEAARRSVRRPTTRRRLRRFAPKAVDGLHLAASVAAVALFAILIALAWKRPPARIAPREAPPTVKTPDPLPLPPPELPPPAPPRTNVPDSFVQPLPAPPVPKPVEAPPAEPRPEPPPPPPRPSTVAEAAPPVPPREFARVLRFTGRADRGGQALRKGDVILAGQELACRSGTLLLELPDESLVVLRAGSTLTANIDAATATLRLAEGELACSVRKRAERRFAVETVHGAAVVRGTMFSVKTQGSGTSVTVSRGRVEARNAEGMTEVAAGERSQMSKGGGPSKPEAVAADRLLAWAVDAGLRVVGPLWVAAGAGDLQAPMTRGRLEGSLAPEAVFAAVDARALPGWNGRFLPAGRDEGGSTTLTVDVPEDGTWLLWGRMFHPASGSQLFRQDAEPRDNDPNSFYVSVDGGREAVFGNHKIDPDTRASAYRRWHWAGDGSVEVGKPAPLKLGRLAKGRHTIRIRPRDAVESAALRLASRLDVLCLTNDPDYRPRDEDYRKP